MTKTEARAVVARSLRYGYHDLGARRYSADCFRCRRRVETTCGYHGEPGNQRNPWRLETVRQALTRALLGHLLDEEECQP